MCVPFIPFETVILHNSHADPLVATPSNVYIVTGCGNGCQASTVHPRMYHRHAIVPLGKEFAAIRRRPSVAWAVFVCHT